MTIMFSNSKSVELRDLEAQGPCGCGALSEARMLLTGPTCCIESSVHAVYRAWV